jgi:tRNA(Ile)-lysidine synthase
VRFGKLNIAWKNMTRPRTSSAKGTELHRELFDADKTGSVVILRHWQPGDRFQPIGMKQAVKLQDFFTNRKVPRERRRELVVATTADGEVFWVEDQRISERFKLSAGTKRWLEWSWRKKVE